ncbi:hypothetical protein [Microbacterium sp. Leaf436]|uniref:hypothetical protein n=1 Tax=Microbacterium sp. Leaf436 TaxID=1736377 RepID=UPI0006FDCEA3|nr:hypothetical protein [Microbacterium sp. Leaf436]KQT75390.1 hypothetical protein ASG45_02505 [Microbacterium sp. Leaf436]
MGTCDAAVVIDFDSVDCDLDAGHEGMHGMAGEGGRIRWELASPVVVTESGYPCSVNGKPCPCGFDSDDCR